MCALVFHSMTISKSVKSQPGGKLCIHLNGVGRVFFILRYLGERW